MFDAQINGIDFESSMKARRADLVEMQQKFIDARDSYAQLSSDKFVEVTRGMVASHMATEHPDITIEGEVNLHADWNSGDDVVCRHCKKQICSIVYHKMDTLAIPVVKINDWEIILPKEASDGQ